MSEVGIPADELAERVSGFHMAAGPERLRAWLVAEQLAEERNGRLTATLRGLELAEALVPNGHELDESLAPFLRS